MCNNRARQRIKNARGMNHLQHLEGEASQIFRELAAECERPVMLYSIGRDTSMERKKQEGYF
jgi:3'-phosphoadenosine 5'-phosphosulfate sulfotransferase (PAPS reductase)/FAD synthetase